MRREIEVVLGGIDLRRRMGKRERCADGAPLESGEIHDNGASFDLPSFPSGGV